MLRVPEAEVIAMFAGHTTYEPAFNENKLAVRVICSRTPCASRIYLRTNGFEDL